MVYFGIAAFIIGLFIFLSPILKALIEKQKCKVRIEAKCIGECKYVDYMKLKMGYPVFQYEYNDKLYEVKYPIYHYVQEYETGEMYQIRINDNNPDEMQLVMPLRMYFGSERLLPAIVFVGIAVVFFLAS